MIFEHDLTDGKKEVDRQVNGWIERKFDGGMSYKQKE